jgi:enediyne polyketide synthase
VTPDPATAAVTVPAPARSPDRVTTPLSSGLPVPSGLTWDVQVVDADERVLASWRGVRLREAGLLPRSAAWPPSLLSVYLERSAVGLGLDPGLRVTVRRGEPAPARAADHAPAGTIPRPRDAEEPEAPGGGGPWMNGRRIVDVPLPDEPLPVPQQAGNPDGLAVAEGAGPLAGFALEAGGVRSAACGWAAADPQHAVWPADQGLLASLAAAFSRLRNHLSESPSCSGARLRAVAACLAMAHAPERAPVARERATGDGWALLEIAGARVACNVVEVSGVSCPVAIAVLTDPPRRTRRPARPEAEHREDRLTARPT